MEGGMVYTRRGPVQHKRADLFAAACICDCDLKPGSRCAVAARTFRPGAKLPPELQQCIADKQRFDLQKARASPISGTSSALQVAAAIVAIGTISAWQVVATIVAIA
eukprot:2854175-Pyramimonas_sp.AAC.1